MGYLLCIVKINVFYRSAKLLGNKGNQPAQQVEQIEKHAVMRRTLTTEDTTSMVLGWRTWDTQTGNI
jgi:hypothetical protein